MEVPKIPKTIVGIAKGDKNTPDVVYEFTNQQPNVQAGRQRIVDVLHGIPGPLPVAKTAVKQVDAFSMYLTDEMIDLIVRHTNRKITNLISNASEESLTKHPFIKVTTTLEIRALIGLMLYRGTLSIEHYHGAEAVFRQIWSCYIWCNYGT